MAVCSVHCVHVGRKNCSWGNIPVMSINTLSLSSLLHTLTPHNLCDSHLLWLVLPSPLRHPLDLTLLLSIVMTTKVDLSPFRVVKHQVQKRCIRIQPVAADEEDTGQTECDISDSFDSLAIWQNTGQWCNAFELPLPSRHAQHHHLCLAGDGIIIGCGQWRYRWWCCDDLAKAGNSKVLHTTDQHVPREGIGKYQTYPGGPP